MYLFDLVKEINIWRKVKAIAKENEKQLNKSGFRVDWVGRIYTVINLPEEVVNQPFSKEGYILMKLREYDTVFLDMGIADVISPEIEEIPGADAYLLILSPDRDYIKLKPFLWSLIKTGTLLFIIRIIYIILSNYWLGITESINNLFNLIFRY
jgi:hypothetical protein